MAILYVYGWGYSRGHTSSGQKLMSLSQDPSYLVLLLFILKIFSSSTVKGTVVKEENLTIHMTIIGHEIGKDKRPKSVIKKLWESLNRITRSMETLL